MRSVLTVFVHKDFVFFFRESTKDVSHFRPLVVEISVRDPLPRLRCKL